MEPAYGKLFNFRAHSVFIHHTKHWAIQYEIRMSAFTDNVNYETVYKVRSKYTKLGAGPHVSMFHVARSNAELRPLRA